MDPVNNPAKPYGERLSLTIYLYMRCKAGNVVSAGFVVRRGRFANYLPLS